MIQSILRLNDSPPCTLVGHSKLSLSSKQHNAKYLVQSSSRQHRCFVSIATACAVSLIPIWKIYSQIQHTKCVLRKADECKRWPFARGIVQSVNIEKGDALFGMIKSSRINIQYEYRLGTSDYFIKHSESNSYRKIDPNRSRTVPLTDDPKKSDILFIPLMDPPIDPEESPMIVRGKSNRVFKGDRIFWSVPYWTLSTLFSRGEETKSQEKELEELKEKFKQGARIIVRINPFNPKESVLICGQQSFDQSWKFTYLYCTIMVLSALTLFAMTWSMFSNSRLEKNMEEMLQLMLSKLNEVLSRSVNEETKDHTNTPLHYRILWNFNEFIRLFTSIVFDGHTTEALPPNYESKTKAPQYLDLNTHNKP
ncbi:hypothetical protein FDP41_009331 [Naegleria fowleri]|uniref:Uncharacterized protein n=1 Tax=Naegleria fowleri TaxID=5763 RepID=A0A6A5BET3_NAEFO|nr:uncharacterized protein FDP41_009331 [Naegleria fowleri]KAF0972428.1 hypothetical protein FDP41_009331 [Naegleria fowleri]CAG4717595.1 unnamed protein product [Naegleria fowleri]